jgi:NAD(P)-dependent dehydrogenase (short-subunit alcohol dehydrogenase family)
MAPQQATDYPNAGTAPSKVWFITGASRGFGRIWTEAALQRGDQVAATARTLASLADLPARYGTSVLTLELDVTQPAQVTAAVAQAHAHFGRLDVVLNNAGYSLVGTIEEASVAEVRALYDTNIFGTLAVIQAALPLLRAQGSGHIVGISSGLGLVSLPLLGYYCSSKWAFEALHESLAIEIKPFGLHVTLVEPGAYATEFGSDQSLKLAPSLEVYADLRTRTLARLKGSTGADPLATPAALFAVVDAAEPPLRLFLGSQNLPWVRATYAERLATWEAWAPVSEAAQGPVSQPG